MLVRSSLVSPSPMLMRRRRVPEWIRLYTEALAAAQAAGAYFGVLPPASLADPATYGPFVGSDASGGNSVLGSGVIGLMMDMQPGKAAGFAGPHNLVGLSENTDGADWFIGGATKAASGADLPPVTGSTSASVVTATGADPFVFRQVFAAYSGRLMTSRVWVKGVGATIGKTARVWIWYAGTATGSHGIGSIVLTGDWQMIETTSTPTGSGSVYFRVDCPGTSSGDVFKFAAPQISRGSITEYVPATSELPKFPGNSATQSTSSAKAIHVAAPNPVAAAVGYGAASFDGADDFLSIPPSVISAYPFTFVMAVANITPQDSGALSLEESTSRYKRLGTTSSVNVYLANDRGNVANTQLSGGISAASVVSCDFTSSGMQAYVDGVTGGAVAQSNAFGTMTAAYLGKTRSTGLLFRGTLGLAVMAPGGLTTDQRKAIERLGAYIVGATYAG